MFNIPQSHWLFPEEHRRVVSRLLELGLIKVDPMRQLPLKSGGKTDVYINLRDARDNPEAIQFLADLFRSPLQRLGVDRFIEVPDSVSCFAGPLAIEAGIPYLTIREQTKQGRVADAKVIGHAQNGERVVIIDDVITNGASKVEPHRVCVELGLNVGAMVVLVDRQQGWPEYLDQAGVDLSVWSGMTLHHVRRQLIEMGVMERCLPYLEKDNPLIVALDGKNWDEVYPIIDQLRTTGCILKVNDMLFDQGISHLLPDLSVYGRMMVDLKCHDVPRTVANTCRHLRPHNPWAVTVHASGGVEMIKAAVETLKGIDTNVLAITVLTSLGSDDCNAIFHTKSEDQVIGLAQLAAETGVHGFVCSPLEAQILREQYPDKLIVTPGVRSPGVGTDDQKRVATPREAIRYGASHLVMGSQIMKSPNPVAEVMRVLKEELSIS